MNTFAIGLLIVGVAVSNCVGTSTSVSSGAHSDSSGGGGTYTQTSGPHGTFTTVNGDGVPFAPFIGQPAVGPGPFFPIPQFDPAPLITPVDFNLAISKYLNSIQRQYATLYRQQQQLIEQWRDAQLAHYQATYGHPSYQGGSAGHPSYQGGSAGASATASYGPGGVHQTAALYPENPAKPNLDSRFGDDRPAPQNGYYGVGTSSFSASSDINGHKTHKHGAITTVNDNGKVTTYRLGD